MTFEKAQVEAVKKWMFYCWNFDSTLFTMKDSFRENNKVYAPSCFEALNYDEHLRDHKIDKWVSLANGAGGSIALINLYFELSDKYREDVLNYIMLNYEP